ncbi:xanthine dehydrogenase family protein molybdopterin-binding subunit [Diaphorobacter ruginosibacter]|uniref:Xanthine dehydrogenase family protein molybdopterin-binding subunit n=1 Tax=Diaphorobacter ruginosibacter TaxID=1715720 RepID=A0A7G9RR43_9BURK|nr:xanthine dehydrogenase family protein molybdopterin-binding subunit [Diaphorobacter ruginosibacter]
MRVQRPLQTSLQASSPCAAPAAPPEDATPAPPDSAILSRRGFLQGLTIAGVSVFVAPLASRAYATLFEQKLLTPVDRAVGTQAPLFRLDGHAKVTGRKIFARDIRARDMPHWPQTQSHAFIVRATLADRLFEDIDLSALGEDLKPDRLVTAEDLVRDGVAFPAFYGEDVLLPKGKTPAYLGHAVAFLIYHDFARFHFAKERLQATPDVVRYGKVTGPLDREPWGVFRYVRMGGATPFDDDVYSSLKDNTLFPKERKPIVWPKIAEADLVTANGLRAAEQIANELATPPADWLVMKRHYATQSIDTAALEPDNANCWYDPASQSLHMVIATQSPQEVAESAAAMVKASRFPLRNLFVHPCYTVGYGSKDHAPMPFIGAMIALYADGKPVRIANNRFEQFQTSLKRHAFEIDYTFAINRQNGLLQSVVGNMTCNGGGRANFSASVALVGATAAQSIYYFPKNDLTSTALSSRALDAGSARGYGTLQSMVATELMMDEIAGELKLDPIELRLRNLLPSGGKNTQGAIAAGAIRTREVLERARQHPIWTERAKRKASYEAAHPGQKYGVGFACVQKDFGTGGEANFSRVEFTPEGRVILYISGTEIGTGMGTSQAQLCVQWFGKPADELHTSRIDWPELPLKAEGDNFTMPQADQDRLMTNPRWTPAFCSPSSASNSAYFFSHTTAETARVVFENGLWPAAVAIWSKGLGGGQFAPYAVRREDARWVNGMLTANGMEPLSLQALARKAYELKLVTGAVGHAFNRWQWAEADFEIAGKTERRPLDGLSIRHGRPDQVAGAAPPEQPQPAAAAATPVEDALLGAATAGEYQMLARRNLFYPPTQRGNAGVTYYSANGALAEIAVDTDTGDVLVLNHHHIMECGKPIVSELVKSQLEGGIAMGIGHALYETMPLYEGGPGDGDWNLHRYHLPRAHEVAVWKQTSELLAPLSETDPPKGIAEVVMIPIVAAIVTGIHEAIGKRFYDLPVTPAKIKEALAS